jgi:hypothetical protein
VIDQVRAALDTYRTRSAFQLYALALMPIVVISYVGLYTALGNHPASYLTLIAPAVAIFFALLGEHMKIQFTSLRSKLIPGYALPHVLAALVTSTAVLLLIPLSVALFLLVSPNVSIATLAAVWTLSLITFSAGYFFVPQVVYLLLMLTMLNGAFVKWAEGMNRSTAAIVLAADLVLTAALLKRLLSTTEESFEYRGKDTPEKFQLFRWTTFSKRLDRPRALRGDVMSHVRHFAAGMRTSQESLLISAAVYAVIFWALNLFTRPSSLIIPDAITLTPLAALMVFIQMDRGAANLPLIFLLPLRREQIVSRYGLALLLVLLEGWLAFAVALILVNWMPVPGKILGFPSLRPFVISLAAQVPIFGLLSLAVGRSRIYVVALLSLSMFFVALASAGIGWFMISILVSGPPLIGFSYRHWCRAELL